MQSARRRFAVVALLAAALALGWTTSRVWGPAVFGSERPSVTAAQGSSASDAAVLQRSPSLVRAFAGDRLSGSWEGVTAIGLAASRRPSGRGAALMTAGPNDRFIPFAARSRSERLL